jgi:hypothetical protein
VTVEMLIELDRLVQLLESPIFTSLRMEVRATDHLLPCYTYCTFHRGRERERWREGERGREGERERYREGEREREKEKERKKKVLAIIFLNRPGQNEKSANYMHCLKVLSSEN